MEGKYCFNCTNWGYNKGKVMNSVGSSRCLKLKKQAHAMQKCKFYTPYKRKED